MIKLAEWNAQGLNSREKLCQFFIMVDRIRPDILFIVETWFVKRSPTEEEKAVEMPPGYQCFRHDRVCKTSGGGILCLVKDGIEVVDINGSEPGSNFEWQAVRVMVGGEKIWLTAAYIPKGRTAWKADFVEEMLVEGPVILCGDFNARHRRIGVVDRDRKVNASGREIGDLIETGRMELLGDNRPTHKNGRRLDLWLCSPDIAGRFPQYDVGDTYGGDHNVNWCIIEGGNLCRYFPSRRFDFTKANWTNYEKLLSDHLDCVKTPETTSPEAIEQYAETIRRAITAAQTIVPTCEANKVKSWRMTKALRLLIDERHKLMRLAKSTGMAIYRRFANQVYCQFKREVAQQEADDLQRKLKLLERRRKRSHMSEFFRLYDELAGGPNCSTIKGVKPIRRCDGTMAVADKDKAEEIAAHLAATFAAPQEKENDLDDNKRKWQSVNEHIAANLVRIQPQEGRITNHISRQQLKQAVRRLKAGKAPGHDNVGNIFLKKGGNKLFRALRILFNMVLSSGYLPKSWKLAVVVPLPRADKDTSTPDGYRPVSLLPTMGKLLESIVASRLADGLTKSGTIPSFQSGFRAGHCTTDQTFRLAQTASMARMRREAMIVAFLDFKGAFNKVWHAGLVFKMLNCQEINEETCRFVANFLEDRRFKVRVGSTLSKERSIKAGVPQGSCLSPILFSLFTADIVPRGEEPNEASTAAYADDITLIASAAWAGLAISQMRRRLAIVEKWSGTWRLPLNPAKCKIMVMSGGNIERDTFKLNGVVLPIVEEERYLGVIFDKFGNFVKHFDKITMEARVRLAALRRLSKPEVSLATRRLLYVATIRPVLEYAAATFLAASERQLHRVQAIEHIALKIICGYAPDDHKTTEFLLDKADLTSIKDRLQILATQYLSKAFNTVGPISNIVYKHRPLAQKLRATPLGKVAHRLPIGPPIRP